MYPASNTFHTAVANGNPQMALLLFPDAVFTNEDIDVEKGIEFNDYFNTEEDISIGQAISNEFRFSLFNDERLLNDYVFGEFKALLGVQIDVSTYSVNGNCMIQDGANVYVGRDTSPYLRLNGRAVSGGPNWPVKSLVSINNMMFCFGENGNCVVMDESTGEFSPASVNAFMLNKVRRDYCNAGFRYDADERTVMLWKNGAVQTYEFVPLGTFVADRPNAPDNIEIDFNCNDLMMKFKGDMPSKEELGITYPVTFGNLLTALCNYAEVPYAGGSFINSDATLDKEPEEFGNCTMRDVVGWIAEAAASNARISRDGALVLDWLKTTEQAYDEHDYSDFQPYWYETAPIDKLHNRSTQTDSESTVGDGTRGYLIQDNPLLRGAV